MIDPYKIRNFNFGATNGGEGYGFNFKIPVRMTYKDVREKELKIPYMLTLKLEKAHITKISGFTGNGVYLNKVIKNGVLSETQLRATFNNTGYSLSESGAILNVSFGNFSIKGGGSILGTKSGYSITKNGMTSEFNASLNISPAVPILIGIIYSGQWYAAPVALRYGY